MPEPKKRRRACRVSDVDYDRSADQTPPRSGGDEPNSQTDLEYYENERPPHYGR